MKIEKIIQIKREREKREIQKRGEKKNEEKNRFFSLSLLSA